MILCKEKLPKLFREDIEIVLNLFPSVFTDLALRVTFAKSLKNI